MSKSKIDGNFLTLVVVAVLCGIFAGILGAIITKIYFFPDSSLFSSNELNLNNLNSNNGLVIRNPQKVVVNQDVKFTETIDNIRPGLLGFFKEINSSSTDILVNKGVSDSVNKTANNQNIQYYKLDEPLFTGLIITSDGWVLALIPDELKIDFKFKNYVVIGSDHQLYKIDQITDFKKMPGDLLLVHLTGATNLPIKKIVDRVDLSLGQSLLIVNNFNTVWPATLNSLIKTPSVLSSDNLSVSLDLFAGSVSDLKNSFVFNLAGDLVAIITVDQKIIPAFYYKTPWSVLSQKIPISQPFLGVNYLDLSLIKTSAIFLNKGAWLYPSATQAAVLKDSPADLAGLQLGDVITWVNNQVIDTNNDLADLLTTYKAGDTITLTYVRDGIEKSANIKLGELK